MKIKTTLDIISKWTHEGGYYAHEFYDERVPLNDLKKWINKHKNTGEEAALILIDLLDKIETTQKK